MISNLKCPCGFGIEFLSGDIGTVVRNCDVLGFEHGMRFYASSDALIEGCWIGSCYTGVYICCVDDPGNSPNPDFGGGARSGDGRNRFESEVHDCIAVRNLTANTIYAKFNIWNNYPPIEGIDYTNEGGGEIIW
jgi:hypothetical protein